MRMPDAGQNRIRSGIRNPVSTLPLMRTFLLIRHAKAGAPMGLRTSIGHSRIGDAATPNSSGRFSPRRSPPRCHRLVAGTQSAGRPLRSFRLERIGEPPLRSTTTSTAVE